MKRIGKPLEYSGIYRLRSKLNGKTYIGSAILLGKRKNEHFNNLKKHFHENSHLQHHVNKYGIKDIEYELLELCPKEKLIEREQYYIDTLNPEFNLAKNAKSPMLGLHHSKETRQKISNSHKGKIISEETKAKMKIGQAKKWTLEERLKSSKRFAGENHPLYGKHHSEETKAKIASAHKGKHLTDEHKKKLSIIGKAKHLTEDHKRNIGLSHKGIPISEKGRKNMSEGRLKFFQTEAGILERQKMSERCKGNIIKPKIKNSNY